MGRQGDGVDVAVVGASFAGLTAALFLARGRRSVALFDTGETRNRFAPASHGFLGQDGAAPDAIRLRGRAEVLAYPTATLREARVTAVEGGPDGFRLTASDGSETGARRVILAHGMRDVLPPVEGLDACWGVSAVQCPYCHGYELADRPTGVLMSSRKDAFHHLDLLRDWTGDLTLLLDGGPLAEEDRRELGRRAVRVEPERVAALRHERGQIAALRLASGRELALGALYLAPRTEPASPLPALLGLRMAAEDQGPHVAVDEAGRTSAPGVYAAGDLARDVFGAAAAAADGAAAGIACHRSLLGMD